MKKLLTLVLSTLMVFGSVGMILATEAKDSTPKKNKEVVNEMELLSDSGWQDKLGGKWRYGVGEKYVWSYFKQKYHTHKTTVEGKKWGRTSSGWVKKKKTAFASHPKAIFGNKAWCDIK